MAFAHQDQAKQHGAQNATFFRNTVVPCLLDQKSDHTTAVSALCSQQCQPLSIYQTDVRKLLLTEPVVTGIEPSPSLAKGTTFGTNGKADGSLKNTLRQHNQPLLLANNSVVLECNTSNSEDCWTVQGDIKIEVRLLCSVSHLLLLRLSHAHLCSPETHGPGSQESFLHDKHAIHAATYTLRPCTTFLILHILWQTARLFREQPLSHSPGIDLVT